MTTINDVKKLAKEGKLTIGTETVLKGIKAEKIKNVILSSNIDSKTKEEIEHYARIGKVIVTQIEVPNDELGTLCKKPFSISVLGY
ncbi:MAG: ribosomal L7Ae/L30e/S12e/Gadd45 family protein [Nanoarchaeota archaeon]|nr:ribosomal L7Ae/L30e/S12e/Gadd45 family protein [Nanoarchaeota archaeon]MBU1704371.1 ribosomal L7Ae/L30e/S12e/Gadd45 family protein [Nanoarchaeota archaeon]